MLWGEPLKETAVFMERVRREAALSGRNPTFSLSTRPILAATDGEAWDRARAILDRVLVNRGGAPAPKRQNVGSKRLLEAAAEAEVHDTCLWTSLAVATGASGNSTALVGTPETVAKAMLEYYKLGATSLLIRGGAPDRVVRRRRMRRQRRLVPVNLEEVIDVRVLLVVQDVEAQAARLIPLRADCIHLDRLEETIARLRLDPDLHPYRQHCGLP